jgi:hypothetical protein
MKLNIFCTGIFLKTEDCEEESSYMQVNKVFLSEDRLQSKEGTGANHTEKKVLFLQLVHKKPLLLLQ